MKIKIGIRHNLIYPILYSIFTYIRNVDTILMDEINDFKGSLLLTLIMFFAEFISGLILYTTQRIFNFNSKESTSEEIKSKNSSLKKEISSNSNNIGMHMLLLTISFCDFIVFIITTDYLPNYKIKTNSLETRLGNMTTIFSSFFYHFLLNFNLGKHQKLSLLIIFLCLLTIIILEIFYESILENSNSTNLYYALFLIIINYLFRSFMDISEKYLLEYHKINAYKMLMMEGIFGFIITSLYAIYESPFNEIKKNYNNKKNKFIILFILLLLYFLLSGAKNIYRILTNKRYSPMTKIIADTFMDPLLIIYYFSFKNDLHNFYFFIFNVILLIIINFFGLVFNDFLILYCCNLEHETYLEISKRAYDIEKIKPLQDFDIRVTIDDEYEVSYERNKTQDF